MVNDPPPKRTLGVRVPLPLQIVLTINVQNAILLLWLLALSLTKKKINC